ncbi:hypothetical protein A3L11_09855 [Thermococcus siculi]|uniref:Uncharacterized protein n=1 Tax=Thermococcus siculi TaxID=72803 RepID=A0A2Z2MNU4_9EURY|nr:hypothetical protein [Thermococcus siculi]ASJ09518.1 hypothetical protein A3L11_09855 [Thermococcus siculi]
MRARSVLTVLVIVFVILPFIDSSISWLWIHNHSPSPVAYTGAVQYSVYFPKTFAIIEASRKGRIEEVSPWEITVITRDNLTLPVAYDYRPQLLRRIAEQEKQINETIEGLKDEKGTWDGGSLYAKLSSVVWLEDDVAKHREKLMRASIDLQPTGRAWMVFIQATVLTMLWLVVFLWARKNERKRPGFALLVTSGMLVLILLGYAFVFTGFPFREEMKAPPAGFLAGINYTANDSGITRCEETWLVKADADTESLFREYLHRGVVVYADDPTYGVHFLVLLLNESDRNALANSLNESRSLWIDFRECGYDKSLRKLGRVLQLGRELVAKGYITPEDYSRLEKYVEEKRAELESLRLAADYRIQVNFYR